MPFALWVTRKLARQQLTSLIVDFELTGDEMSGKSRGSHPSRASLKGDKLKLLRKQEMRETMSGC